MNAVPHVAYFCMEFGLDESFPIYSGGLGVLAGDFIKSARDLKLPVIGGRAALGARLLRPADRRRTAQPYEEYPVVRRAPALQETGVHVRVRVRGEEVPCIVWVTDRFGHVPLYLIEPFRAEDRWITHRLYEAGTDVRIAQEMLLGIGGVRGAQLARNPDLDLPLQRGPRGVRRHRDDRRAHGGRPAVPRRLGADPRRGSCSPPTRR